MNEGVLRLPQALTLDGDKIRPGSRKVEDVVTELYAQLRSPLLSYTFYLVGCNPDAEDLIQVAFLRLFDQLSQGVEIRNHRGWLYRIVHNLAVERSKQSDRRSSLLEEWFDPTASVTTISAEEELVRREQIESSLGLLNERERHALMLRAEGFRYSEISEIMRISVKSVSVYLARGLKKFELSDESN